MKIRLFGSGKMGKMVAQVAQTQGRQVVDEMLNADICIDFSHPEVVIDHVKQCCEHHKNLVIGTTGWDAHLHEVRELVTHNGIGVLYAPNFSLGVHLFLKILEHSAQLMNHFVEYAVAGVEFHHATKKDAPSGTALDMCRRVEQAIDRIDKLDITAVRVGSIPGKHLVLFDSPFDTISICHEARSREGFAQGALKAVKWLIGKSGFLQWMIY